MAIAAEVREKQAGETRNVKVNATDKLDTGELLTGTPVVAEVTTTDLTISNAAKNSAEMTVNGETVAISSGYKFTVAGGTAGQVYKIKVTCSTDDTAAQSFEDYVTLVILETPA